MSNSTRLLARTSLTLYLLILLTLTHIPHLGPIPEVPGGDKTLHFTGYFIAGLLLQWCFSFRWQLAFAVALIALIGLGAVDEITQAFVNRTPSIFDWYADDFKASGGPLAFIQKFGPATAAETIEGGKAKLDFADYDSSLNAAK